MLALLDLIRRDTGIFSGVNRKDLMKLIFCCRQKYVFMVQMFMMEMKKYLKYKYCINIK